MVGWMSAAVPKRMTTETVVSENRRKAEDPRKGCTPLWLTQREAESLLVLCASAPVGAGPAEQDLFVKLGDFFHEACQ